MEYKMRKTAPSHNNKDYYSKENIFYPSFTNNCTWYCFGRAMENGVPRAELIKKLPSSNAENWYKETKFEKCSFPRVGDIICYKAGKYHHAKDGEGHVATVEKVYDNGDIDISESGAKMKFQFRKLKKPYKFYLNFKHAKNYKLDGFIHMMDYDSEWVDGYYKVLKNKYVRTSPEVNNNKVKYKSLPASYKNICTKTAAGYAQYKKGSILYLTDFKYDKKGNLWGKHKIYYICVKDSSGKQVEKI